MSLRTKLVKLIWLGIFPFLFVACSSAQKTFSVHLDHHDCAAAASSVPEEKDLGLRLISRTQQTGGTLFSYAFTGISYTAEILMDVAGGTVMVVALCGPMVAAEVASHGVQANAPITCIPGKLDALSAPPLGRQAYTSSQEMRCPNVTPLSRSLRQVAACYEQETTPDSWARAERSLSSMQSTDKFYRCLSHEEQRALDTQLKSLKEKMASH
jgi:hypothetical protein